MNLFDVYPLYDLTITRAQGSWLWDSNGQQYLDFYGGHAVISIGHTHPHYLESLTKQLQQIGFYSNSVIIAQQHELAEKLGHLSGKENYQLFLCNSGAEANENALKLASFHNGKGKVVAFNGSFHGRTSLAVATTDNPALRAPINESDRVIFAPFNDPDFLAQIFEKYGDQIACVITEGIQGVGGIQVATPEFLQQIRSLCDRYGALYIADSVQCGCGRSGRYYSHDRAGVSADIYTMAKGIGNGFPIGALAIAPHITPRYGMLGTTFGGNHLACAAAIAVVDVILSENLLQRAAESGNYLQQELRKISGIQEIRGEGLMIGIELPNNSTALRQKLLFEEKIFVGSAKNKNIIRLLPALNISHKQMDRFLEAIQKQLKKI